MQPYSSARKEAPSEGVLLNANESPWPLLTDPEDGSDDGGMLNRYPEPQPHDLVARLAKLYRVPEEHLLITRGSDEGIDLLTRVFCRAGRDAVLQCPPTFGMYRIAAQTQGADIVSVNRLVEDEFRMNSAKVAETVGRDDRIRLVFLTSPNNPTGDTRDERDLGELLEAARGRALVIVDEAYAEFSGQESAIKLINSNPHLAVLRTMSKAWAAAGLRCGVVLAQPEIIGLLRRIIAPYPLSSPVIKLVGRMLDPDVLLRQQKLLRELAKNKKRLLDVLDGRPFIRQTWPGKANFVLIRASESAELLNHCASRGVILRGFSNDALLQDCIRISVGSEKDLSVLAAALDSWEAQP
jgi:histidinol-phosphate aminotransferase